MSDESPQAGKTDPRDAAWAKPVGKLKVTDVPAGAINLNIEGRQLAGPLQGFGKMWQKTFRVRLPGVNLTPAEVMQVWKENFPKFQPPENHFYPSMSGVKPGEFLFIDSKLPVFPNMPGIIPYASGVMVLYADDESFTVATPRGFADSGWNTFSVFEEDGCLVAQAQSIVRAADPIYEFGNEFMGGTQMQDRIWIHVLTELAAHFGVKGQVMHYKTLLDPKLQWSQAKNVWYNAGIRTFFYTLASPLRWVGKAIRPKR